MVKTTLGPKGMDKILQRVSEHDTSVSVTNDGATILRSVMLDNPAAKVLVDIARVQDDEVGDGTTSVAVFCGELLREAEKLVNERIHPQTIAAGWRMAKNIARKTLEESAIESSKNEELFRKNLFKIAKTTLSSKLLTHEKDYFAQLAVDAVMRLKGSNNLDYIQVLKKAGGHLRESYLEDGFLLDKQIGVGQPKRVENAKILIANTSMDTDKIKIYGSRVKVDSMTKVAEIEEAEKEKMRQKCEKIIAHGANVFINRQLIYNLPESIFAERGIMAIEHADFDGVERLAAVTGGEVASTFDHPELVTLGECDVVEEIMIGEDKVIRLGGCKAGEACTIVLRGASSHVLDEAERSLHDALCVLQATVKEPRVIYGGGCSEIYMAQVSVLTRTKYLYFIFTSFFTHTNFLESIFFQAIDREVVNTPGKKALAMAAFARALRAMPAIIADNGGYDSAELVTQLRAKHESGGNSWGLDMYHGQIADMEDLGVMESFKSKLSVLMSASEAAEMILRVDDIIKCAPRQREQGY
jgi:T-complex protein 1 subunit beta